MKEEKRAGALGAGAGKYEPGGSHVLAIAIHRSSERLEDSGGFWGGEYQ